MHRAVVGKHHARREQRVDEETSVGVVVGGTYTVSDTGVDILAGAGPIDLCATR